MREIQARKRTMVEGLVQTHLNRFAASGCELVMGRGCFIAELATLRSGWHACPASANVRGDSYRRRFIAWISSFQTLDPSRGAVAFQIAFLGLLSH